MEISFSEDVFPLLCFLLFMWIFAFILIKQYIHKSKAKKLKYEWTWVLKKLKVSAVREKYIPSKSSWWYYLYWLESKDESWNTYKSESFRNANHGWRTPEEMKVKYDWVVYDLWNKEVISQLNETINWLEIELSNYSWFFKNSDLINDIESMKQYIKIAKEWPITPYLFCNWHKISVWDTVDIFVDPKNPKLYYFDLDFTKEK